MNNKKYYAVAGKNGFGVFTCQKSLLRSSKYITCMDCQECSTLDEAKKQAVRMYRKIQENPGGCSSKGIIWLNWFYFISPSRPQVTNNIRENQEIWPNKLIRPFCIGI